MIEISDLTFAYEDAAVPALEQIALTIRPEEWLAVIGANGSGKSTLARQLNGLLLPGSGRVLVDGLDTKDPEALLLARQKVAFVFQNPDNQLIATSVEDDIAFGPENLGLPPQEITWRVEQALAAVGLTEKRQKPPHLLSGGEKQRVAIAGALAMASRYLVLDEPTSMLDPELRQSLLATLTELHRQKGLGLIYVTNLMEEAVLADRVIVLHQGKLVKDGTPREVFRDGAWLQQLGLALPQISQLAFALSQSGYPQVEGALTLPELCNSLTAIGPARQEQAIAPEMADGACWDSNPATSAGESKAKTPQICGEQVGYTYQPGSPNACCALQEVSFSIPRGQLVGVIGHGGSGKSTLATLLAGLFQPGQGSLTVNGQAAAKDSVFEQVGLVFQYPEQQLFGETVFEEVAFGPKNFGVAESKLPGKVRKALQDVGMAPEQFWNRSPFALSGGQKRRICIAGVLATDPQIMILDEPTAGLDEGGRRWILDLILRLHRQGKTILWISHNMSEVAELAQRLLVLSGGRLIADGTPRQVFAQAETLAAAGLETPPVQQLCSRLRQQGWPLPPQVLTVEEAKLALLQALGGGGHAQ